MAYAQVESAKLMRQAADILSSAAAMQIRYLEVMQAMAKSSNTKVIFLPGTDKTKSKTLEDATQAEGNGERAGSRKDVMRYYDQN